jgi:H+/Cl- antiporter ClcA
MSSILLGVIASLSGVIVGAVATYLSQVLLWKRTIRRELYGNFAGRCNVCRNQLLDVEFAIRKLGQHERDERWERANAQIAEMSSLAAQVSMVATTATRNAAEALERHLSDLKDELHARNKGTPPRATPEYLAEYSTVFRKFIATASKELGIARTS